MITHNESVAPDRMLEIAEEFQLVGELLNQLLLVAVKLNDSILCLYY